MPEASTPSAAGRPATAALAHILIYQHLLSRASKVNALVDTSEVWSGLVRRN